MRKTITGLARQAASAAGQWLDLETLTEVEVSSEDPSHPIEGALLAGQGAGWRAAGPGRQSIRLVFANAQPVRRIHLRFTETGDARTQEYALRWSPDGGNTLRDIVRQQWNFSPDGSTSQTEDHRVELPAVTVLELVIVPHIGGGPAIASLETLRLA